MTEEQQIEHLSRRLEEAIERYGRSRGSLAESLGVEAERLSPVSGGSGQWTGDLTVRQLLRLAGELGVAPATLWAVESEEPQIRGVIHEELARLVGWPGEAEGPPPD